MSAEGRTAAHESGMRFLLTYQWLADDNLKRLTCLFKIKPKHHYFCHVVDKHLGSAVNPKWTHNFQDEDFMGKIARLCGKVNACTVMLRAVQRYLLFLGLRFEALRRQERGEGS